MSKQQHIIIVSGGCLGSGDFFRQKIAKTDNRLIICCDGGAKHLKNALLFPDVLVGDMDSIASSQLVQYERQGVKIIKYPADKDFSDTALALDYALSLHPRAIDIWGAQGGRIDHFLANVFLLLKGKKASVKTRLMDEYCEVFAPEGAVVFTGATGCLVSLLTLCAPVEGLTLEGFLYPLHNETLTMSESRGLSNIICDNQASIRFEAGDLLVVRYWQKDIFPEAS